MSVVQAVVEQIGRLKGNSIVETERGTQQMRDLNDDWVETERQSKVDFRQFSRN